jgi:hypothetical protein
MVGFRLPISIWAMYDASALAEPLLAQTDHATEIAVEVGVDGHPDANLQGVCTAMR